MAGTNEYINYVRTLVLSLHCSISSTTNLSSNLIMTTLCTCLSHIGRVNSSKYTSHFLQLSRCTTSQCNKRCNAYGYKIAQCYDGTGRCRPRGVDLSALNDHASSSSTPVPFRSMHLAFCCRRRNIEVTEPSTRGGLGQKKKRRTRIASGEIQFFGAYKGRTFVLETQAIL